MREEPSWEEPIRFIRQLCPTDATLAETPAPEIGVLLLKGCQRSTVCHHHAPSTVLPLSLPYPQSPRTIPGLP